MKKLSFILACFILACSFAGCDTEAQPGATPEPVPDVTAFPAPTATPAPTSEPTPTPTPEPTPTPKPGPWCLEELGLESVTIWDVESLQKGNITFPKDAYYLDEFKTMYVETDNAHRFAFTLSWDQNWSNGLEWCGDEETVIAEYKGWSCCISKSDGKAGWIASDHLSKNYPFWLPQPTD